MKVWSRLRHQNIAPLLGFHLDSEYDAPWLLSPWEDYGNIGSYLKTTEPSFVERLVLVRTHFAVLFCV